MAIICLIEDTEISLKQVYELTQIVYNQRIIEGMKFRATQLSFEEYKKEFEYHNARVFVAIDECTNELCGAAAMYIKGGKFKYAHFTNAVVSPNFQRQGIGSQLKTKREQFAKEAGCNYITSTTGVNADSSVRWHLKNGYRIIGKAFWNGYYSYIFRKQITHSILWTNRIFCSSIYIFSVIKLHVKLVIKRIIKK